MNPHSRESERETPCLFEQAGLLSAGTAVEEPPADTDAANEKEQEGVRARSRAEGSSAAKPARAPRGLAAAGRSAR